MGDLMAGMLFVFIILLAATMARLESEKQRTKELNDSVTMQRERREELLTTIIRDLEADEVTAAISADRSAIELGTERLFGSLKWQPSTIGMSVIRSLGDALADHLENEQSGLLLEAVLIEGHTDNLPIPLDDNNADPRVQDNWDLSSLRSIEVYKLIVAAHPELEQLRNEDGKLLIATAGWADRRPTVPNTTKDNRMRNRRIDIRFVLAAPKGVGD